MFCNALNYAILASVLAGCVAADRVLIGFRVVSAKEAAIINDKSNIFRDSEYCYVKADENRLDSTPKTWIPKISASGTHLWGASESTILNYVRAQMESGEDEDNSLRLGLIELNEPNEQLLIPTSMANNDALDFYARCFASQYELSQHYWEVVNYDSWTKQRGRKE
ncbi:hypothetical protein CGCF415_v010454 [Colletotrichum fructicola]|uniref:Uncharacterized protein n=1 Tax=Colletotrichum fructicola (strain Nara gc5) TaxID=1213859 RepID=L2FJX2_COLFN|nr:hypothetical protein CGCF415_v010454 [Colletotrichum fructicola]KAF4899997.1 hypothetical protein CGCFRS4_v003454 [Colletotrichum fructicola]KAF4938657.1 hypothetical protein CGCF245_v004340 [Colletotrichum fructicola]